LTAINYFDDRQTARRYAQARPSCHALAARRIAALCGRDGFARALDCGCGTGASTHAMAAIAEHVTGIDPSAHMLAEAEPAPRVDFRQSPAETLPFAGSSFDLVTVAAALHWFDAPLFFGECRRVLAPGGVLAVYNDHFTTHLRGAAEFSRWMRRVYLRRYRASWRGMRDFDAAAAAEAGFGVVAQESFEHNEHFTRAGFADYLLTHSNALSALRRGQETAPQIAAWLDSELQHFLPDPAAEGGFLFKCNLWLLQPADSPAASCTETPLPTNGAASF
jgi:ubiquinone/menaquinone biosynthesis C-methylase UbiE